MRVFADGTWTDVVTAEPREILVLRRKAVGYVTQFLRVIPRVPAEHIVAEPLIDRGVPEEAALERARVEDMSEKEIAREIKRLEKQMLAFARDLEFEKAAAVRDQLAHLRQLAFGAEGRDLPAV